MRDYTGKTIYLGMDVHKESYSLTAVCEGEIVKSDKIFADPQLLINYCRKFFRNASIVSAYEAGFCGFSLHRSLINNQIDNLVVHPSSIEMATNDRVKTDKRDSLKIATQLSLGRLKSVYIPSIEQEACRSITRLRATLAKQKTRCVNRIKGFLHYNGIKVDWGRACKKSMLKLRQLEIKPDLKLCLELMIGEWEKADKDIRTCEDHLVDQSKRDILEEIYRSVPGVGSIIARVLSNELGDMSQFANERQLFSYCGLTPCEYSSGNKSYKGHITRQGKATLRMHLTQAAWRAIKKDATLEEAFERISVRAGRKRAIQAIARKLVGRIRSCLNKKELYEIKN